MLKKSFVIVALLLFCSSAYAQENKNVFTSGNTYSYLVTCPEGWVADYLNENQLWYRVFHPKDSTYKSSAAWIYVLAARKDEKQSTLERVIATNSEYKQKTEKLEIKDDMAITTAKDLQGKVRRAKIRYHTNESRKIFEAVVYIEESNLFVNFVLQSRGKKEFQDALPAFKELVGSYSYLTDKVVE